MAFTLPLKKLGCPTLENRVTMADLSLTSMLTSSLMSAILGGLVAGIFTLRVVKHNYINDYYKTILQKRLYAYGIVENLITMLKTSVVDSDGCPYHIMFFDINESDPAQILLQISSQSMWLSEEITQEAISLSHLVYTMPALPEEAIEYAKKHYRHIAEARTRFEKYYARDFLGLHDIKAFLKSKRPTDFYVNLPSSK